jgi:hypothetical protein
MLRPTLAVKMLLTTFIGRRVFSFLKKNIDCDG